MKQSSRIYLCIISFLLGSLSLTLHAKETNGSFMVSMTILAPPTPPVVTQGDGSAATPAQVSEAIPNILPSDATTLSKDSALATGKPAHAPTSDYQVINVTY